MSVEINFTKISSNLYIESMNSVVQQHTITIQGKILSKKIFTSLFDHMMTETTKYTGLLFNQNFKFLIKDQNVCCI